MPGKRAIAIRAYIPFLARIYGPFSPMGYALTGSAVWLGVLVMSQNSRNRYGAVMGFLLLCTVAACSTSPAAGVTPVRAAAPLAASASPRTSFRAILYFRSAVTDGAAVSAVIGAACRCQAVFVRQYSDKVLIYTVALPQGTSFSSFQSMLMQNAAQSGIELVEQDQLMQHQ